jgi:hypothetical protein
VLGVDRITIEPVSWEHPYLSQYEDLRRDLTSRGLDVRLVGPAEYEDPGTNVFYHWGLLMATPEVVIHSATHIAEHALDILGGALIYHMIGKVQVGPKGMRRRVQIVGPDGQLLKEVELPPGDDVRDDEDDDG